MRKRTSREGASAFTVVALVSFVGALAISVMMYSTYRQYIDTSGATLQQTVDESNELRKRVAELESLLPGGFLSQAECGSPSMGYLDVMNFSVSGRETRAITFINAGDCVLTTFSVSLNGNRIYPYYAPDMVFPGSKGVVILYPDQAADWHSTEGEVEVTSAQGAYIVVGTRKGMGGITANMYLVLTGEV